MSPLLCPIGDDECFHLHRSRLGADSPASISRLDSGQAVPLITPAWEAERQADQ